MVAVVAGEDAGGELQGEDLLDDSVEEEEAAAAVEGLLDGVAVTREELEDAGGLEALEEEEREGVAVWAAAGDDGPVLEAEDALAGPADEVADDGGGEAPGGYDPVAGEGGGRELGAHLDDEEGGEEEGGAEGGDVLDGLPVEEAVAGCGVAGEAGEEDGDGALEGAEEGVEHGARARRGGWLEHGSMGRGVCGEREGTQSWQRYLQQTRLHVLPLPADVITDRSADGSQPLR